MKFLMVFAFVWFNVAALDNRTANVYYAEDNEIPYQVGIETDIGLWCNGILIDNEWILSSASCVGAVLDDITVYLGSNVRAAAQIQYKIFKDDIVIQPELSSNRIALVKIPFTPYNDSIQPVKLPAITSLHDMYELNVTVLISGWGYLSEDMKEYENFLDKNLHSIAMNIVTDEECRQGNILGFSSSDFCAIPYKEAPFCAGYMGSAVVLERNHVLAGVVYYDSVKSCTEGPPVAFVRITSHLDWIKEKTGVFYEEFCTLTLGKRGLK